MEQFRCGDVHLGCDAVFTAASPLEVLRQATRHEWETHDLHLPHLPAATVRQVLALIKPVPAARATSGSVTTVSVDSDDRTLERVVDVDVLQESVVR